MSTTPIAKHLCITVDKPGSSPGWKHYVGHAVIPDGVGVTDEALQREAEAERWKTISRLRICEATPIVVSRSRSAGGLNVVTFEFYGRSGHP